MAVRGIFTCKGCGHSTELFVVTNKEAVDKALAVAMAHENRHVAGGGHSEGFTFDTVDLCGITMEVEFGIYQCNKQKFHMGTCSGIRIK